ncbi:MAG: ROK family protein [Rhodothermales bacterium]
MEILGIDVGGSGIKGYPVDTDSGEALGDRIRIPTPSPATPDAIADAIVEIAKHFSWSGPVGCALPARVKNGIVKTATNINKAFIGYDFAAELEKRLGSTVATVNDADAAGIAEMRFGAGRGRSGVVLLLTIGTGIGSALFIDGALVPNTEFGHINVEGHNGELYASDRTREKKDLSWKKWSKRFQHYLDRIEFLLGPDLIIIGGGVSKPERKEEWFKYLRTEADLVTAQTANRAGIIGAACNARDKAAALSI